jgi:ABC-type multidrug transport system ATPase subunit
MSDTVLRLEGVSKSYGSVPAVEDASLEVARGEVFTLLGPSGCGKTTTLRSTFPPRRQRVAGVIRASRRAAPERESYNASAVEDRPRTGDCR